MPPYENDDSVLAGLYSLSIDDNDDDGGNTRTRSPQPLPLTGIKVEAKVHDFIAEVKLSQCYKNDLNKAIEAIYHFPIHEGAAVCGFEAEYEDGSIVKGLVKEKEVAKQQYDQAKQEGKQANLLESIRPDVFTLSVGNLPAGGFVKINITYVATLEARDNAAALILPTSIAPRYTPVTSPVTMAKAKAKALSPPQSPIKLFGLDIDINARCLSEIKAVICPTHTQDLNVSLSGRSCHASFHDIALDRDVVVLIEEEKSHQLRACIEVAEDGKTVTGLVTFYPQIEFPDLKRDFVFVIDRSCSMNGRKIMQARDTLLLFLRSLPVTCTFNIVGFGSRYEALFDGPQSYNDATLESASQYAASMNANFGGTELLLPLQYIFGQPIVAGVEREIFVLTDGQVSNNTQVFDLICQHCNGDPQVCRLFSVGIGDSVSRHLVSGMARAGRGTSSFVEDSSSGVLCGKVLGQLKQSLQPSLDNVSLEWKFSSGQTKQAPAAASAPVKTLLGYRSPSIDDDTLNGSEGHLKMYPSANPPIFNKEKYLSYAMFPAGAKLESVSVKCVTPDGPLEMCLNISGENYFEGSTARKLAARTAIAEYEDLPTGQRYNLSAAPAGCISKDEALELALVNGLASKQTSFIAVKDDAVVDPAAPCETKVIPQVRIDERNATDKDKEFAKREVKLEYRDKYGRLLTRKEAFRDLNYQFHGYGSGKRKEEKKLEQIAREQAEARLAASSTHNHVRQKRAQALSALCGGIAMKKSAAGPASSLAAEKYYAGLVRGCSRSGGSSNPPPPPPPQDKMLHLCILQKANGSFVLDERFIEAVGLTKEQVDEILVRLGSPDQTVFATVLALVVLRLEHANNPSHWELQEQKALGMLAHWPGSANLITRVEAEFCQLKRSPGVGSKSAEQNETEHS